MLQLYNLNHNKLDGLTNYKDLKIEREINVDTTLSFLYPNLDSKHDLILEETYIRTKENEYVVKVINVGEDWTEYICKINLENIKGNFVSHFEAVRQTCTNAINLALVGTGWTIGTCDVVKLRTVRKNNVSSYVLLQEIQNAYGCEMTFDSVNKKVYVYKSMGTDKGTYFAEQLNLKKLDIQRNSYDYITRLIPVGKDSLGIASINNGKNYIENYQYSNKIITAYWEDNRYTVAQDLLEDGTARLNYLSKPYKSYSADVIDLANISDTYKNVLEYSLGDTITLLSKSTSTKEKQRIIKITEFPEEPEKNSCEIANKLLSLEDIQVKFVETSDTVDSVTTSTGEIDGTKVDGIDWTKVQNVHLGIVDIQDMSAVTGRIGTLEATSINTTTFNAYKANIEDAVLKKATIIDLTATNEKVNTLEVNAETVNNLLAHNIGANNLAVGAIQAGSEVIGKSAISSAQIISLDVLKINAGIMSTNKFMVQSDNGNLKILGDTVKLWDVNGKERISLGLNSGDYNLLVRGADGVTVLFGTTGVTHAGITQGAVDDTNIATNANINGSKIEKESMVTQINGATTLLKSSHIKYDPTGQTLDVAFGALSNTVTDQGNKVNNQATSISALQGQIALKVEQTDITNTVTTAVNNIQIGGRNLFKGYGNEEIILNPYQGIGSFTQFINKFTFKPSDYIGKEFTISFYAKSPNGITKLQVYNNNNAPRYFYFMKLLDNALSTDWKYYSYTFVNTDRGSAFTESNKIEIYAISAIGVIVKNIKLESGNKATDWTPAPEDIDSNIATAQTNAQNNAKDYTNGQITTVDTKINTANASIDLLKNAINLKVETSIFNSTVTNINGEITNTKSRLATTENSISILQNGINLKASQSSLDNTNSNLGGVTNRLTTAEGQLTVQAGQIALKVSKDGIISAFNLSSESAKLSASKIDLTGFVTFSSLSTPGSATIDGGNIKGSDIVGVNIKTASANNYVHLTDNIMEMYQTWTKGAGAYNGVPIQCFSVNTIQASNITQLYLQAPDTTGTLRAATLKLSGDGLDIKCSNGVKINSIDLTTNKGNCIYYPDGKIEMWGEAQCDFSQESSANGYYYKLLTINLPVPFPNTCTSKMACSINSAYCWAIATNCTKTTLAAGLVSTRVGGTQGNWFSWRVVGY